MEPSPHPGDQAGPPGRRRLPLENVTLAQSGARHSKLLARTPFGATEATMSASGFARKTLAGLIRAGLATVQHEKADGQTVGRVRITEAGRRAIEIY
jgi:hypothetical protein